MAITNYSELITAITSGWMHRSNLASAAPEFVAMAEDKFNRRLRTRHQETALSETAIDSDFQMAIPSNTVAVKRMWRTDDPKTPLDVQSLDFIISRQGAGMLAHAYAWEGTTWRFDGTGSVAGVLYRNIPALSATQATNWLITNHPGAYLYACMAEACTYIKAFDQAERWEAKADAKIAEIAARERLDEFSGPLLIRAA